MALLGINISGLVLGLLAILFGVFVLVFPRILRYLVAFYFIIAGVIAVINAL
ncbi:MAG: DUF3096 domain-containing protein [Candidatus Pacearchaeota archaeon]|nr:DUF3096 domain-containing protein [Candidatus Pacearchaeota archaeon]